MMVVVGGGCQQWGLWTVHEDKKLFLWPMVLVSIDLNLQSEGRISKVHVQEGRGQLQCCVTIHRQLISTTVAGASTSITPETKRRWREESGEDMNSITTTSAGPCWLSSPCPRAKDGHSESLPQFAEYSLFIISTILLFIFSTIKKKQSKSYNAT